jgi:hypothetical protein
MKLWLLALLALITLGLAGSTSVSTDSYRSTDGQEIR